jgi:hypothetical protein
MPPLSLLNGGSEHPKRMCRRRTNDFGRFAVKMALLDAVAAR